MSVKIRPWMLVTMGIAFNIFSAIITHYFIDLNNQKIRLIENKINNIDSLIENQWRSKTQVDRKEEFLLSMLARTGAISPNQNSDIQNLINLQLADLIKQQGLILKKPLVNPVKSFSTITSITNQAKTKIINVINNTYLERIELDEKRHPLSEQNALLSTLAIFLQVSGLIMVLSKDINS